MGFYRFAFCLFLCLCFEFCHAQKSEERITYDTTYHIVENNGVYDTTIYVHKHVEIIEHVFIIDSLYKKKWAYDASAGVTALSNSPRLVPEGMHSTEKSAFGFNVNGSLYRNFKSGFHLRASLRVDYYQEKRLHQRNFQQSKTYLETDTLDRYMVVDNFTDTAYYYVTEEQEKTQLEEQKELSESKHRFWHIKIPLQLGYKFNKKNWGVAVLSGMGVQLLIHDTYSSSQVRITPLMLSSIQVHYAITDKTLLQLEPNYQYTFKNKKTDLYPSDLLMVNLGVKHFF